MNQKELLKEVINSEHYYRVTIDSEFEDFKTLNKAVVYIKKVWKKDSYYCSIKLVSFIKNGRKKSNPAN